MKITIDIPNELVQEAMKLTNIKTKTDVIKEALSSLIQREKIKKIKNFYGKIKIDIDLDITRN